METGPEIGIAIDPALANFRIEQAARMAVAQKSIDAEMFWRLAAATEGVPSFHDLTDDERAALVALCEAYPALIPPTVTDIPDDAPEAVWKGLGLLINSRVDPIVQGMLPGFWWLNQGTQAALAQLIRGVPRMPELLAMAVKADGK